MDSNFEDFFSRIESVTEPGPPGSASQILETLSAGMHDGDVLEYFSGDDDPVYRLRLIDTSLRVVSYVKGKESVGTYFTKVMGKWVPQAFHCDEAGQFYKVCANGEWYHSTNDSWARSSEMWIEKFLGGDLSCRTIYANPRDLNDLSDRQVSQIITHSQLRGLREITNRLDRPLELELRLSGKGTCNVSPKNNVGDGETFDFDGETIALVRLNARGRLYVTGKGVIHDWGHVPQSSIIIHSE